MTRRSTATVAASVLALSGLLAACGSQSAGVSGSGASGGASKQVPSFDDPVTATAAPQATMTPAPTVTSAAADDLSLAWQLEGISGDNRRLYLKYVAGDGDCVKFSGFAVVETDQSVSLTATASSDPSKQDCASVLRIGQGYVELADRLGDRKLVHPPVAAEWSTVN